MTTGELLFYGGLIGVPLVAVGGIIAAAVFAVKRKRLKFKLDEEYKFE